MEARRPSITLRLTLSFTLASALVLLGLGLLIGNAVARHFVEQDLDAMRAKLRFAGHLLEQARQPGDLAGLPRHFEEALVGHDDLAVVMRDAAGQTLFATPGTEFPPPLLDRGAVRGEGQPYSWRQGRPGEDVPHRGISALLPTGIPGGPPVLVAIAVDISHHEHFMDSFQRTLWLFVGAAAALTALLGWLAVRRGLAPLREISVGAAGVTASRLDYRLRLDAVPAELTELAAAFNQMLARLEDSFRRLSDFSSDLAHELRTPISNLMTETHVALSRARSADDYRETLASNAEEFERLARMIRDMLFLAQADNGLLVPNREAVDLAGEVRGLFEFFDALSEEKHLQLSLTGEGTVAGDRLMLQRALANLIANAIHHAPQGGRVAVGIEAGGRRVTVENTGSPIPQQHLPRIFDRFYRVDPARHRASDGAGLGLAITRSIARAHGAEIAVANTAAGVRFEIRFAAGEAVGNVSPAS